jgi:serine/threonine protein kinase
VTSGKADDVDRTIEIRGGGRWEAVSLKAGAVLESRYKIEAAIGEGGSGEVFRAWDRVLGEPVALKILRPDHARDKSWIRRLAREVKVGRAIRHPNVCRVFDLSHVGHHWFVSMELASGGSLRDALHTLRARPLADRLTDARAICAGLAAIHAVGITHRDVTPQNVLRMGDGRLMLSDFGLAVEGGDSTVQGGTPRYMPPETAMGQRPDQRSDVWQLGWILHEVIFDGPPEWRSSSRGIVLEQPRAASLSPLQRELARLVRRCLAASPADRPANAIEVSARLAAAEPALARSLLGWFERRWRPMALGLMAAALLAALGLWGGRAAQRPAGARLLSLSAADQQLLRSAAATLDAQGRREEARRLAHLAALGDGK